MDQVLLQFTARETDEGRFLRDFLQRSKGISRRLLIRAKYSGDIQVNGETVYVTYKLKAGDVITITLDEEESETLAPEPMPLDIRYEDDDVLLIAKPAGLVVHPTGMHLSGTLANGVVAYWQSKGENRKFRPVSRLDRDTTGLILIAQNQWAHDQFSRMQKERTMKRTYQAVVHGVVEADEGVIHAPIGRKETSIIEREVREDGQEAITHYKVLARGDDRTLVQLQLETGRTHQIRVHMAYLGHPLLGDDLYGGSMEELERQALHAYRLEFVHPRTGEQMEFVEAMPEDMVRVLP
ncbi:RluA family pseudouridine synthase [Brevibacillus dissolubilis]|uniref:RluA family pseudouridine synthase n=1 Tax=Brevibacillus dissolubilis TaxID=1844116 RepID=UPI001116C34F|nr:RluA family pseudouridine synthase [Brevibacillus dissolubilis]